MSAHRRILSVKGKKKNLAWLFGFLKVLMILLFTWLLSVLKTHSVCVIITLVF